MNLPEILIFTETDTPRLRYVLDWLLVEQLGFTYTITHDETLAKKSDHTVFYGKTNGTINLPAAALLDEKSIEKHDISSCEWNNLFVLYYYEDSKNTIPFDLFSGIFYLLSRYEEYLPFPADKHGRYPYSRSILSNVLERPVIDEWVEYVRILLERTWNLKIPKREFRLSPTYDIDIAWSYLHKGRKRWLRAAAAELVSGKLTSFIERCKVSAGSVKDPYDSFEWMHELHEQHHLNPIYFILSTAAATEYDKNIPLKHPAMEALVLQLADDGEIGIHPSYFTKHDNQKFLNERLRLRSLADRPVTISRQHYIRLLFPATYRMLMSGGIDADYSMGYSTTLGFRAGTSRSFYWYDIKRETATKLRLFPFCFMDTTALFDLQLDAKEAFARLGQMAKSVQKNGGTLCTVFHNFSLGSDKIWHGWADEYKKFIITMAGDI